MKAIAIALPMLACLAGCGAQAASEHQQTAIDQAVADIMCAPTVEDRQAAISVLGNLLDDYQGHDEDETASSAVDGAIDAFVDSGCPRAISGAPASVAQDAPPPA